MAQELSGDKWREWRERLDRFEKGKEMVSEFCLREGVSQATFYKWKKRMSHRLDVPRASNVRSGESQRSLGNAANSDAVPGSDSREENGALVSARFQPVEIVAAGCPARGATLRMPGGIELELGGDLPVIESVVKLVLAGGWHEGQEGTA